jgi:hypothetical protein
VCNSLICILSLLFMTILLGFGTLSTSHLQVPERLYLWLILVYAS